MSAAISSAREGKSETHEGLLAQAAETGDRAKLKALLAQGANVNAVTESGMTPLMRAASNGYVDIVQILLDRGADVNAKRVDGFAALTLAAFFGHLWVVRLLLQRGANIEADGRFGTSAEIWATVRGFWEIVETLKDARLGKQQSPQENLAPPANDPLVTQHPSEDQEVSSAQERAASNSETTLEASPVAPEVVSEMRLKETTASAANYAVGTDATQQSKQVAIRPTARSRKTSSDTLNLPLETPPEFRPALVFFARMTSNWQHVAALTVAVMIFCGIATFAVVKIVRARLGHHAASVKSVENQGVMVTDSVDIAASPEQPISDHIKTPVSDQIKTDGVSSPKPNESRSNLAAAGVENSRVVPKRVSFPNSVIEKQEKAAYKVAEKRKGWDKHLSAGTRTVEFAPNKRTSDSASNRGSAVTTPNRKTASTVVLSQPKVVLAPPKAEPEEPKPAPLSVEVSRRRTLGPSISSSATEGGANKPTSVPMISGTARKKVIQWP